VLFTFLRIRDQPEGFIFTVAKPCILADIRFHSNTGKHAMLNSSHKIKESIKYCIFLIYLLE
jgi:hypothetical protein